MSGYEIWVRGSRMTLAPFDSLPKAIGFVIDFVLPLGVQWAELEIKQVEPWRSSRSSHEARAGQEQRAVRQPLAPGDSR